MTTLAMGLKLNELTEQGWKQLPPNPDRIGGSAFMEKDGKYIEVLPDATIRSVNKDEIK